MKVRQQQINMYPIFCSEENLFVCLDEDCQIHEASQRFKYLTSEILQILWSRIKA